MSSLFFPYNLELQYSNIFERFGALDCMLVLEYIWIFEYPPVFFAGYLDIWSLGAALPRGQGGKIGNLPNQQPPRAPEIVPHKKENFQKLSLFLKIMIMLFITRLSVVLIYERMLRRGGEGGEGLFSKIVVIQPFFLEVFPVYLRHMYIS